jgi:hypothetical protein
MSFANATPVPRYPLTEQDKPAGVIQGDGFWPDIDPNTARVVLRLNGTVTNERLVEALQNAIHHIDSELAQWREKQAASLTDKQQGLYRRAVYFCAKADLTERYLDFDTTAEGQRRVEDLTDAIDSARRNVRWAIHDLQDIARVVVEAL